MVDSAAPPRSPPSEAPARVSTAEAPAGATGDAEIPLSGNNRTRPMRETAGTLATFISLVSVDDAGVFAGACVGAPPRSTARSIVRNGAVNGASARSVRQHAVIRDSIGGCDPVEQVARHRRRALQIVAARAVTSEFVHVRRLSDASTQETITSHRRRCSYIYVETLFADQRASPGRRTRMPFATVMLLRDPDRNVRLPWFIRQRCASAAMRLQSFRAIRTGVRLAARMNAINQCSDDCSRCSS
jgi:hypothetical protein